MQKIWIGRRYSLFLGKNGMLEKLDLVETRLNMVAHSYSSNEGMHARLETQTPSETEKIIKKQQEKIERLKSERIALAEEIADIRRNVEMLLKERSRE